MTERVYIYIKESKHYGVESSLQSKEILSGKKFIHMLIRDGLMGIYMIS